MELGVAQRSDTCPEEKQSQGQKKSDGSAVSVFMCPKKDMDPAKALEGSLGYLMWQVAAAKNADQVSKTMRRATTVIDVLKASLKAPILSV